MTNKKKKLPSKGESVYEKKERYNFALTPTERQKLRDITSYEGGKSDSDTFSQMIQEKWSEIEFDD